MGSVRLANDPDKYIRRIRGGRFQARPYDEGVRYNLGTFATAGEARVAIREFWRRSVGELPKHTHSVTVNGVEKFMVRLKFEGDGWTYQLGPYDTREQAGAAAAGLVMGLYGPLFGEAAVQRIDHFLPWSRKLERKLAREMAEAEAERKPSGEPPLPPNPRPRDCRPLVA